MKQEIKERIEQIKQGLLPSGYKQTPVGILPSDWKLSTLSSISKFIGGGTPSTKKREYWNGEIPWISSSDVVEDNIYKISISRKINQNAINNSATKLIPSNSVLVVTRVGVGKVVVNKFPLCTSQDYTNIVEFSHDSIFLAYYLKNLINKKLQGLQGTSIKGITTKELSSFLVLDFKIKEQQKIANVLTTWDNAVELQEKKIERLQEKKKALMQKLLTPKPDWKEARLGEICEISTGKLDANKMVEDGVYPFFTCSKDVYRIDNFAYDCEALLMAGNGEIGDIKYYNGKFNAYQRTYVLTDFKLDTKYVMQYLLLNFDKTVCKGMQKSSMPYIKLGLLQDAIILYPKNSEQLSKTLNLFDDKIQIENQLLEKYKEQRKALMQLLLTGIVRV